MRRRRGVWAAWLVAALLAFAVARFWHPAYGFTAFLQFDSSDAPIAVPGMRAAPVYVYPGHDGYDGSSYAEVAFDPLLLHPEAMKAALGNVPYRARRILGSALAWVAAGGRPLLIAKVYAALNLAVWPLFAVLAWKLIGVDDSRKWWLWFGLVCSAGALHAVRLALTDLLGTSCFAFAMLAQERGRKASPVALLALGGLARETILANGVAWGGDWAAGVAPAGAPDGAGLWFRRLGSLALVLAATAVPVVAWALYLRLRVGPAPQGFGNFSLPILGWWEKWEASFAAFRRQPQFFWVDLATVLSLAGVTAQAAYLVARPRVGSAWWRAGATGVLMMACFGTAVWEGNPGAALRVLLPMSFAFAVLVSREGPRWAWVIAGNLSVLSGVLPLATVPHDPKEMGAGRAGGEVYVIREDEGWFPAERRGSKVWAWTERGGEIEIRAWGRAAGPLELELGLRALSPRAVEVRVGPRVTWTGTVDSRMKRVEVAAIPAGEGSTVVTVSTPVPPTVETGVASHRPLGIAIYNPELRK